MRLGLFPALVRGSLVSTVGLVCALSTPACAPSDAAQSPVDNSKLETVRGRFAQRLVLTGELMAVEAVDITVPRTPLWSIRISWLIADGAEVVRGDKIIEFDNVAFSDDLDEKRIAVDRSQRNLEQEKARAEAALITARLRLEQTRISREKAKLEASIPASLLSRKTFQEHQLDYERTRVEYEKAWEDLQAAEATGETEVRVREVELEKIKRVVVTAEHAIDELVIEAPEDGIIIVADHPWEGRKFKEGDSPWVGLTVLRMPNLMKMQVRASLFDVDDTRLEADTPVVCTLDTYPDLEFSGIVRDITPIAQEAGVFSLRRVFDVNIDLDQTDPTRMRPGMSVKVVAVTNRPGTPILAPRMALEFGPERARARLADGSWADVRIGDCSPQICVVEEGLDEGVALMAAHGEGP